MYPLQRLAPTSCDEGRCAKETLPISRLCGIGHGERDDGAFVCAPLYNLYAYNKHYSLLPYYEILEVWLDRIKRKRVFKDDMVNWTKEVGEIRDDDPVVVSEEEHSE